MKTSTLMFVGALLLSVTAFVSSHTDIHTFADLFGNVQNFFGLLGVIGAVCVGWVNKSPLPEAKPVDRSVN